MQNFWRQSSLEMSLCMSRIKKFFETENKSWVISARCSIKRHLKQEKKSFFNSDMIYDPQSTRKGQSHVQIAAD